MVVSKHILVIIIQKFWYNNKWCNALVTTLQVILEYNQSKDKKICNTLNANIGLDQNKAKFQPNT